MNVKPWVPYLVMGNIFLTFLILVNPPQGKLTFVGSNSFETKDLRKIICQQAFEGLRNKELSDFFIHPSIIEDLSAEIPYEYDIAKTAKLFIKMQGLEVCRVIVVEKKGVKGLEGIVSENGPLLFRVTTLRPFKPTITQAREVL